MLPDANSEMMRLNDVATKLSKEAAKLRNALRYVVRVYVVDDDAWDVNAETECLMQRFIADHGANA